MIRRGSSPSNAATFDTSIILVAFVRLSSANPAASSATAPTPAPVCAPTPPASPPPEPCSIAGGGRKSRNGNPPATITMTTVAAVNNPFRRFQIGFITSSHSKFRIIHTPTVCIATRHKG